MKTSALIRIVIWSLVIVLLTGTLAVGIYRSEARRNELPSTEVPITLPSAKMPSAEASAGTDPDFSTDSRQIKEIEIEWVAGHIIVEAAKVDSIEVFETADPDEVEPLVWKQHNDKLIIRFRENMNFAVGINDILTKDLTIRVPLGWECDSLDVDAASATVGIKNLAIREVDFDGASGTCNFENCAVGELDLDTASGDIYFTGSLNVLDCDAASASVYAVFDNVPDRIEMDSMSGDLDITLPSDAGFSASMDALSSDFISDFSYTERNGNYHHGDGKCKISLDALSGDLYIREYKEADAIPAGHHHTDECTTNPDSCPDNLTHHTESQHK